MALTPEQLAKLVQGVRSTPAYQRSRVGQQFNPTAYRKYVGTAPAAASSANTDWERNKAAYLTGMSSAQKPGTEENGFDKFFRPVTQVLNAITAGGSGMMNALDKGLKLSIEANKNADIGRVLTYAASTSIPAVSAITGVGLYKDFADGFFASWNSAEKSENYMTGSKLIESMTDRFGKAYNPDYRDKPDNVDPVAKGVGGFVADVGLDPLTYVPGGLLLSAGRGAVRAGKAGGGITDVVKGVKVGTDNANLSHKVGAFNSQSIKPVGLDQWMQARNYDKFDKIARQVGVDTGDLFKAFDGGDDALARLADLGKDPAKIREAMTAAEPYLGSARAIWDGASNLGKGVVGRRANRRATGELGAAEYLYPGGRPGAELADEVSLPESVVAPAAKTPADLIEEAAAQADLATPEGAAAAATRASQQADEVQAARASYEASEAAEEAAQAVRQADQAADQAALSVAKQATDEIPANAPGQVTMNRVGGNAARASRPARVQIAKTDKLAKATLETIARTGGLGAEALGRKLQVQQNRIAALGNLTYKTGVGRKLVDQRSAAVIRGLGHPPKRGTPEFQQWADTLDAELGPQIRENFAGNKISDILMRNWDELNKGGKEELPYSLAVQRLLDREQGRVLTPAEFGEKVGEFVQVGKDGTPLTLDGVLGALGRGQHISWNIADLRKLADVFEVDITGIAEQELAAFLRTAGAKYYDRYSQLYNATKGPISSRDVFDGEKIWRSITDQNSPDVPTMIGALDDDFQANVAGIIKEAGLDEDAAVRLMNTVEKARQDGFTAMLARSRATGDELLTEKDQLKYTKILDEARKDGHAPAYTRTFTQDSLNTADSLIWREIENIPGKVSDHLKLRLRLSALEGVRALAAQHGIIIRASIDKVGTKAAYRSGGKKDFGLRSAFIDQADVLRIMPDSLADDLLYTSKFTGQRTSGKPGEYSFPPSVLAEAGVFAMKIRGAKLTVDGKTSRRLTEDERFTLMEDFIRQSVSSADEAHNFDQVWASGRTGKGQYDQSQRELADLLRSKLAYWMSRDKTATELHTIHHARGMLAGKLAQLDANMLTDAHRAALDAVTDARVNAFAPLLPAGDKIKAVQDAIDGVRRALTEQGVPADSLVRMIAKGDIDRYVAIRLDPASALISRIATRNKRVQAVDTDGNPLSDDQIKKWYERWGKATKQQRERHAGSEANKKRTRESGGASKQAIKERIATRAEIDLQAQDIVEEQIKRMPDGPEKVEAILNAPEQVLGIADDLTQRLARGATDDFPVPAAAAEEAMSSASEGLGRTADDLAGTGDDVVDAAADRTVDLNLPKQTMGQEIAKTFTPYGMDDTRHLITAREVTAQNVSANYEGALESVTKQLAQLGVSPKALNADAARWATLKSNQEIFEDVASRFGEGVLAGPMREFAQLFTSIFSHDVANAVARTGLDSDQIMRYLKQSGPMAMHKEFWLTGGMKGWEVGLEWKDFMPKLVDPKFADDAEFGGIVDILKGYSWALRKAAIAPNLGADMSYRFGHDAFGYTADQARALGWARIKDEGDLGKWVDPDAYFPPEIVEQMKRMQEFLHYERTIPHNGWGKAVRASDRVVTPMKASLTLWRPGHHVVSAMGEWLANMLMGVVNPVVYSKAITAMRAGGELHRGTVFGKGGSKDIDELVVSHGLPIDGVEAAGVKLDKIRVAGSGSPTMAQFYQMLDRAGVLINHNTAEDLLIQGDEVMKKGGRWTQLFSPIVTVHRGLGEMAARRDNVFRIAHAIHVAERRTYRSWDDLAEEIQREIYRTHPTMQTLTAREQKVNRRIFYFYTWQRQALTLILKSVLERPGSLSVPAKFNYEASVALGGAPQSIGQPMPDDPNVPSWGAGNILGPSWYDEHGNLTSLSVNAPQLDILQSFFGGMKFNPDQDLAANFDQNFSTLIRENTLGQASPVIKTPMELLMGTTYRNPNQPAQEIQDRGDYLLDQTGLGYLSRATGRGFINNDGLFGMRSDVSDELEQQDRSRMTVKNWMSGLREQNWSKYGENAQRERDEETTRMDQDALRNILGNLPRDASGNILAGQ